MYSYLIRGAIYECAILLVISVAALKYREKVFGNAILLILFSVFIVRVCANFEDALLMVSKSSLDFFILRDRDFKQDDIIPLILYLFITVSSGVLCLLVISKLPRGKDRKRRWMTLLFCIVGTIYILIRKRDRLDLFKMGPYDRYILFFNDRAYSFFFALISASLETFFDLYAVPELLHKAWGKGKKGLCIAYLVGGLLFAAAHFIEREFSWILFIYHFLFYAVSAGSCFFLGSFFPAFWVHFLWNFT